MHFRRSLVVGLGSSLYGLSLLMMDVELARAFGASRQSAIFIAAYLIPSLLCNVASGGTVVAAFIPHAVRLVRVRLSADFPTYSGAILKTVSVIALSIIFAFSLASGWLGSLVMFSADTDSQALIRIILLITLPILVFHAASTVIGATLQAADRYAVSSIAPSLIPGAAALALALGEGSITLQWVSASLLAGAIAQLVVVWSYAGARGVAPNLRAQVSRVEKMAFLRSYAANVTSNGFLVAALIGDQSIAGSISIASAAHYGFGTKLVLLLLAFSTTVVANTVLPHFSHVIESQGYAQAWRIVTRWSRRLFAGFFVISLAWYLVAPAVIATVYRHGAFSIEDVALVAMVQRVYIWQMPFYVVGMICLRMLNAAHANGVVILSALLALISDLLAAWLLKDSFGTVGVAAGHAAGVMVWTLTSWIGLRIICRRQYPSNPANRAG